MCDYKPCFVCWSFKSFSPLWLPSAMLLVFNCRVDEIEVQIISNIRLVLLFWLSCTHTHTRLHTRLHSGICQWQNNMWIRDGNTGAVKEV